MVHTVWQYLAQLKTLYQESWRTILNNCGVIQAFGFNNRDMASQWGDYFDHGSGQLRAMTTNQQILSMHGQGETICQRLNYLSDPQFAGMFDADPLHVAAKTSNIRSGRESSPTRGPQSDAR